MSNDVRINVATALLTTVLGLQSVLVSPMPCLLRCKDNHLFEMRNVMHGDVSEWSAEFVAPLQAILHASKNYYEVERMLRHLCRANSRYATCLDTCDDTSTRDILISGHRPAMFICQSLLHDSQMHDLLPCWTQHKLSLEKKCHWAEHQLRASLNSMANTTSIQSHVRHFNMLCRASKDYESCWLTETANFCGSGEAMFLLELSQQTSTAMKKMMRYTGGHQLPESCRVWNVTNNYTRARSTRLMRDREELIRTGGVDTNLASSWTLAVLMTMLLALSYASTAT